MTMDLETGYRDAGNGRTVALLILLTRLREREEGTRLGETYGGRVEEPRNQGHRGRAKGAKVDARAPMSLASWRLGERCRRSSCAAVSQRRCVPE